MGKIGLFLAAMLYGASWVVVVINSIAIAATLREGGNVVGYLPTLVASVAVIFYIHFLAGWPPFKRKA